MLILADFPKPVHGMSSINLAIYDSARCLNKDVKYINTVPSYAAKLFGTRYWGVMKVLHTFYTSLYLILALLLHGEHFVYRPINGGRGQVYDLLYLTICRIFRRKIVIHHHSFNYINSESRLFRFLNYIAGKRATHVVLGSRMADLLVSIYGISRSQTLLLSNVAFFEAKKLVDKREQSDKPLVIGHLANLCIAKGVDDFILLCKELSTRGVNYRAIIAGPFADAESKQLVETACLELAAFEYLGGLYDDDKERFFKSLDVFIFPSKYKNEAEPLVLYEAGQYGALNIGSRQGCMQDVIEQLEGVSFDKNLDIVLNIANEIQRQEVADGFSITARKQRVKAFGCARVTANASLNHLLASLVVVDVSESE
jgi:glycosyltransferase involved in cell wall biosynthesis